MFLIHRTDDDGVRGFVTAVQVEKWKNFFSEGILKGVNMGPCSHIIKRHLAFFVVHIHAHSLGLRVEGEQWWWGCWRSVSLAFLHGQSPIALGGAYRDPALSVNRWPRHTKVPVILFPHLDLPVVSARSEALMGQYYNHRVEAIGVVREVLPGAQVSHLMSILRELQPRVSCVRVKSDIHCRRTRQRIYFVGEFNDENTRNKNKLKKKSFTCIFQNFFDLCKNKIQHSLKICFLYIFTFFKNKMNSHTVTKVFLNVYGTPTTVRQFVNHFSQRRL